MPFHEPGWQRGQGGDGEPITIRGGKMLQVEADMLVAQSRLGAAQMVAMQGQRCSLGEGLPHLLVPQLRQLPHATDRAEHAEQLVKTREVLVERSLPQAARRRPDSQGHLSLVRTLPNRLDALA